MKSRIKYKILIPLITLFAIVYSITLGYIAYRMYEKSSIDGKIIINTFARENAVTVAKSLNREINVTKTLAQTFEIVKQLPQELQKKFHIDILKNVSVKNPDFLSVGCNRQLHTIDKNWKPEYGRDRYTFYREDGELLFEEKMLDLNGEDTTGLYYKIRKQNKNVMVDPYKFVLGDGDSILSTSICFPVKENGDFTGLVVIDISLERLKVILGEVDKNLNQKTFLFSNNGEYVVHEDITKIGVSISKEKSVISKNLNLLQNISSGNSVSFNEYNNKEDEEYYVHLVPIKFGGGIRPWSLAVSVPMSKVTEDARHTTYLVVTVGIIGLLVIILFVFYIAGTITKPLHKSVEFTKKIAAGDLTAVISLNKRKDEIGKLVDNLHVMVYNIKNVIEKAKETTKSVSSNSNLMKNNSITVSQGSIKQAASAEEVSASMEEILSSIEQNKDKADKTANIAMNNADLIKESEKNAKKNAEMMYDIAEKITVIDEIAFQTNIIALNTAIEASHAGSYGKGFTVVSKEVRKLSEKSKKLAAEIMELSEESIDVAERSVKMLNKLTPDMLETSEHISDIYMASREQNAGVEQINNAINNLNMIIQKNVESADNMQKESKTLSQYAQDLKNEISFFKT